jgi:hypothetical protein
MRPTNTRAIIKTPTKTPSKRRCRKVGVSPAGLGLSPRSSLNEYPPLQAAWHAPSGVFVAPGLVYTSSRGCLFTGVRGRLILRTSDERSSRKFAYTAFCELRSR